MLILALISFMAACSSLPTSGLQQRKVTLGKNEYCYQIFLPKNFTPKQKWPVILFLHGAGERGSDCNAQTEIGLGRVLAQQRETFPAIVVMPQCRSREVWFGEMEQYALQALEQTIVAFNGDRSRIYLTGLSMGGYGTFYIAARNPNTFAALLPICGGVVPPPMFPFPPHVQAHLPRSKPYETIAKQLGKTPVWIFHGDADPTIPVSESRNMAAALRALGNNVKYTEYAGVEHNSWDRAYAEKEWLPWVLKQKLIMKN